MMWPFKKNPQEPAPEPWYVGAIKRLEEWRPIGDCFIYLGRNCVVTHHYRSISFGLYSVPYPGIRADYADDTGVIHDISFSWEESLALMRANP